MGFIAGRYTATLAASSLGQTAKGIKTSHSFSKRLVTGDAGGDTKQDAVYRGSADVLADMILLEYNAAAARAAFWPYASTFLDLGIIGRMDVASNIAAALVLTAIAGTTAAATPASMTLTYAILMENFPVELLFAPDLREVPLKLRLYPNASNVYGSTT